LETANGSQFQLGFRSKFLRYLVKTLPVDFMCAFEFYFQEDGSWDNKHLQIFLVISVIRK